jgi:predicted lipoprotein with Yx(FWY)xxD motif
MNPDPATLHGAKRHRFARFAAAAAALGGLSAIAAVAPAAASTSPTVKLVNHAGLGKILVNSSADTVYIFTADSANKATCTGGCASVWPPVMIPKGAKPKGGPGINHLGTVPSGGKLQVTWNKHPLYTYALDTGAGIVNGNGVKEGSGTWFAATAKHVATASTATKTSGGGSSSSGGSSGGYGY